MLFRFSLYGFLKNQQYYDPFLILAFREKGLSFFAIGLLIGFRELAVNVMEMPTGALADLFGRRRAMIFSFLSYIVSFGIFGASTTGWQLVVAMLFFSIGEAFRTGTHKAMILDWLRLQGREDEKTSTYGFTRSWSKMGSAVSVIIAAGLVFYTGRYSDIFWFSILPYALGIINFLGYPPELDGRPESAPSLRNVLHYLWQAGKQAVGQQRLRRTLLESMGYESVFKATKDYLQPVLKQMALALPFFVAMEQDKRAAVLIGAVYFVLHLASSVASRNAGNFAEKSGGTYRAARRLWTITALVFLVMTFTLRIHFFWLATAGFVLLALLQNFWRPITVTRIDNETDATRGATMLSIESQAKAAGSMILAPLLGLAVDVFARGQEPALWIVGAVGAAVAILGASLPAMQPPAPR